MNHNAKLCSSEIANLWTQYQSDSMAVCMLKVFKSHTTDPDILPLIEFGLSLAQSHVDFIRKTFTVEGFPIPLGFTDEDIYLQAKPTFSEPYYPMYLFHMGRQGMAFYGLALGSMGREDLREFYAACLSNTAKLFNQAVHVLQHKGLFIRAPYIPYPETIEYVHKTSFLNGFFGDRRPLTSMEIAHIHLNTQTNVVGKSLIIGFEQTVQSEQLKEYFHKGKHLAKKIVDTLSARLINDNLPAAVPWDTMVTGSTEAQFSDKLMLYQIVGLCATGVQNFGNAIASSQRSDVVAMYGKLSLDAGTLGQEGAKLLIDAGWMEKIPCTVDREALAAKH
jgi:hypothetical protein